jgi:hypothetical protein
MAAHGLFLSDPRTRRRRCCERPRLCQTRKSSAGKFHPVSSWKCQTTSRIYSPLMFAALRIGHHFSISALW